VLFRHDKTFYHPAAVVVEVADNDPGLEERVGKINHLKFERVGLEYTVDLVGVRKFAEAAKKVAGLTRFSLMLISEDAAALKAALDAVADRRPVLAWATPANQAEVVAMAKEKGCPVVVKGDGLDGTAELAEKVVKDGCKEIILDTGARETSAVLADLTQIRRQAIKKKFRPLGHPTVAFTTEDDPQAEMMQAAVYVAKYASMVVIKAVERPHVLTLLTWRQNIYTDPQKPIQVQTKVYEVGEATPKSPVYITTNFSLTYYTVEGEVAASKIPAYIIPCDTDGTSVLTAWAAGKLTGESIAETMKKLDIESKVEHKDVVIPGYVAVLSGKLKEESGWNVIVGPREAAGIPSFAKEKFGK